MKIVSLLSCEAAADAENADAEYFREPNVEKYGNLFQECSNWHIM